MLWSELRLLFAQWCHSKLEHRLRRDRLRSEWFGGNQRVYWGELRRLLSQWWRSLTSLAPATPRYQPAPQPLRPLWQAPPATGAAEQWPRLFPDAFLGVAHAALEDHPVASSVPTRSTIGTIVALQSSAFRGYFQSPINWNAAQWYGALKSRSSFSPFSSTTSMGPRMSSSCAAWSAWSFGLPPSRWR